MPVLGEEGRYEVSSDGRVRSLIRKEAIERVPLLNTNGYYSLNMTKKTRQIHVMVLEAFYGPRPDGLWACHKNGCRTDNRIENLRWDTPSSNARDAFKHGTRVILRGEDSCRSKLTEEKVMEIRGELEKGVVANRLAERFGVSPSTIHCIKKRKVWGHL